MKWSETGDSLCPVARAAAIVGDKWTLLILREAFLGARRFDEFQSQLGVSPHLLSVRLKHLVAERIFTHEGHKRAEYKLTKSGRNLQPLLISMAKWGDDWRSESGRQVSFVHAKCQHNFTPQIVCSTCGDPVGLDVETHLGSKLINERENQVSAQSRTKSKSVNANFKRD